MMEGRNCAASCVENWCGFVQSNAIDEGTHSLLGVMDKCKVKVVDIHVFSIPGASNDTDSTICL